MQTKMRIELLKAYAGILTAAAALVIFTALMYGFTNKDLLEILVVYALFIYPPAFAIPYLIAGEDPDDENDEDNGKY